MISVVMPHHAGKTDITPCLRSLLSQTGLSHSQYEVIVVENPTLSLNLSAYPSNFKTVLSDIPSSNAARNLGISKASNNIIALIDDDVVLKPNHLSRLIGIHGLYPNLGVVGGKVELQFEVEKPRWLIGIFESYLSKIDWDYSTLSDISYNQHAYLVSANLSFTKTMWRKVGGFPDIGLKGLSDLSGNDEVEFIKKCGAAGGPHVLYDPDLSVNHIIPKERVTTEYFMKRAYGQGYADARDHLRDNAGKSIQDIYHDWVQGLALSHITYYDIMQAREKICHEESTREYIRNYLIIKSEYLRGLNDCLCKQR